MKTGAIAFALAAIAGSGALAQDNDKFFEGKTITIYVGLSAGGGYDQNARLVARHFSEHIPGAPTIVVRNMPGGGGLVMANYVSEVAPKDGLHIAAPQRGVPFEPLLGGASHAKFDPLKLNWIGSTNSDTSVAIVNKRTGVTKWQDLRDHEVIVAGTGVGTESVVVPYVVRNILGLKFKVIAGYPGGSEMNLAMERGEVDGRGTFSWTSLKPHLKKWVDSGEYNIIYQMGLRRHPDIPNVPLISEIATTKEQRDMLKLQFSAFEVGRPLFVADGVPADRVQTLRRAFDATMADKDLRADAAKRGLEIDPMKGEDMVELFKEVYSTPKDVVERLAAASKLQPDLKVIDAPKKKKKKKAE